VDLELAALLRPLAKRAGLGGRTACNIGRPDDFRVPDQAYFRDRESRLWYGTAAIVVEVISPDDESRRKLGFYHGAGVEEMLLVDPQTRTVEWLMRGPDAFEPSDGSTLLGITCAELERAIDWPD
jgi:Uma2 family endonuclease